LNDQQDVPSKIAQSAVEQGWKLNQLTKEYRDLETVFKEINKGQL